MNGNVIVDTNMFLYDCPIGIRSWFHPLWKEVVHS